MNQKYKRVTKTRRTASLTCWCSGKTSNDLKNGKDHSQNFIDIESQEYPISYFILTYNVHITTFTHRNIQRSSVILSMEVAISNKENKFNLRVRWLVCGIVFLYLILVEKRKSFQMYANLSKFSFLFFCYKSIPTIQNTFFR